MFASSIHREQCTLIEVIVPTFFYLWAAGMNWLKAVKKIKADSNEHVCGLIKYNISTEEWLSEPAYTVW